MTKTPVFVGSFIFGMSLLVESLAILGIRFFDPSVSSNFSFFEALFIYIPAVIGGFGIGLAIAGDEEYRRSNSILAGIGIAGMVDFAVWLYMQSTYKETIPEIGIGLSFIAGLLAVVGLWIALVSYYQGE
ncbi:MAG: hypothetical protein ACTSP4_06365 [Candidatus Hodarchaeales archaeon]